MHAYIHTRACIYTHAFIHACTHIPFWTHHKHRERVGEGGTHSVMHIQEISTHILIYNHTHSLTNIQIDAHI